MLSRLVNQSVRNCFKSPHRSIATAVKSRTLANHYKKLTFLGFFGSSVSFDYFVRDSESISAVIRFARSLKIAVEISVDYNVGLRGLNEASEGYEKVRILTFQKNLEHHFYHSKRLSMKFICDRRIDFLKVVC
jgi:hypothetical protein